MIDATLYTDAGCPWAYSANPALRVLEWRFREQLRWRLVMIGLREEPSESAIRTFEGERALARWRVYEERYGMPFGTTPKSRAAGTGRGCRAVVAAGMLEPGSEWAVFRTLQIANFTSSLYLDDAESIRDALGSVPVSTPMPLRRGWTTPDVRRGVRAPAGGGPIAPRHARRGCRTRRHLGWPRALHRAVGRVPAGEETAVAGGWQPLLAYDTLLANFAPGLERMPPPESPAPLLEFFAVRADDGRGRASPR